MIDTIIFDVGRVLVNWDYESYLKRFAFGPEKTKAIAAATFEGPYWRQFDRGILAPEEIVKGFCSSPRIHRRNQRGFRPLRGNHHPAAVCRKLGTLLKRKRLPPLHPLQLLRRPLRAHQRENALPPYMDGTLFSYTCHLTKPEPEIYQHLIRNSPSPRTAAYSSTTPKQTSRPQSRQGFMEFILRDMKMACHS